MASAPSLKTAVLKAGECVILPKDAVITSIIVNGSITATSDCTLPVPSTYKCGVFYFFTNMSAGEDDGAMEEEQVQYSNVKVGGNTYIINENVMLITGIEPGTLTPIATLNLHITDTALFEFKAISRTVLGDRQRVAVYFQTPEDLFDTIILQLSDRGTLYNLPVYEATCEEYPDPE